MRLERMRYVLVLALSLILSSAVFARKQETGFLDRAVSVNGTSYKYQVFLPESWSANKKWPIILFLHGAGERGSDGLIQTQVGIATAIRINRSRFPAVVVIPQCVKDGWWTQTEMEAQALAALSAATKEFKGDTKRTYLTGLSMGGYGSWDLAVKYPGKFAAIVPICGGLVLPEGLSKQRPDLAKNSYADDAKSYADAAAKIGKTPIWIFHGGDDPVVPVEGSRKMEAALKAAGGNVQLTVYPGVGHNSWDKAYSEPELMTWMLSKSL